MATTRPRRYWRPATTATEPEPHVEAPAALGDMAPEPVQSVAAAFARQPNASGDQTQPSCVDLLETYSKPL